MSASNRTISDFIQQLEGVILEQLSNEHFGVSELAAAVNMSRSNLLRKVKKETDLSASQFIRQVRLVEGMKMLRESSLTVSEVSYQVGFGSTSYFIKCFREHYGHPPGEVGKGEEPLAEEKQQSSNRNKPVTLALGAVLVIVALVFYFLQTKASTAEELEKSIAVLPFKNDSSDSTNLYFVNGLMESALNNLQKVEDLRVVSRTSVEKYRNSTKGITEIAKELNVSYIVEGSGQKVGDQVMLNIQLIEASSDEHLWAEQYSRKVEDVFAIQNEVAKKMTEAIRVIVTPEELAQIEKRPTENLEAYDFYLRALGPYYSRSNNGLKQAISLFKKAVALDPEFSLAYADLAISYFYLDIFKEEKTYTDSINNYADKALLYDAKSDRSLVAKALYYMHVKEYRLALPILEKALEYNPNSATAVHMLADHYANYSPNTAKYLEYALRGLQINLAPEDSSTQSYTYLHLSNALIQSGFEEEAVKYVNLSLAYDSNNFFTPYARAFILYPGHKDLNQLRRMLLTEWQKDTSRLDILQEIGKVHYMQRTYDSALYYYQKFTRLRSLYGLDIFTHENAKIGIVYEQMGLAEEAAGYFDSFADYCERDQSIYNGASRAGLLAHQGKIEESMEQLKVFSNQNNFQYWIVLFLEMDPIFDPLKSHPEFDAVMDKIEARFWEDHERLRGSLEEKGLI